METQCCGICDWATPGRKGNLMCCNIGGKPHGETFDVDKFSKVNFGDGKNCPEFSALEG